MFSRTGKEWAAQKLKDNYKKELKLHWQMKVKANRESLALPKNDKEDYEFCKKYYELYKAKLFLGLL